MEEPRLKVSARLRSMLTYGKLAGETPRMLVLESQYWLDAACMNAARTLGWEWTSAPVSMVGRLPRADMERLLRTLVAFRPDFVLTINLSGMDVGGLFAQLLGDLGIPLVAWFVDDPRTILMGRTAYATPCSLALTWDSAYTDYLKACGFPVVVPMPLAVDPALFDAPPAEMCSLPPAFVGNSMADFAEQVWRELGVYPELAEAVRGALDADWVTRERFGEGIDALLPDWTGPLDAEMRRKAEMVFFIEGTRRRRADLVQRLTPEGLVVHGDPGWRAVTPLARDYVDYRAGLAEFYRQTEVNLNITSIQMPNTVNQRVFDCPAAGGFLLTDAQRDLETLFDVGTEVARYNSPEECLEKFRFYRVHPEARQTITKNAHARILGEHTYAHRLQSIAAIVKEHWGG